MYLSLWELANSGGGNVMNGEWENGKLKMENGKGGDVVGNIAVGCTSFFSASPRSRKMWVSGDKSVVFSGDPKGSVKCLVIRSPCA